MKYCFLILLVLFAFKLYSQCCSLGNNTQFNVLTNQVDKRTLYLQAFHKYTFSTDYFEENSLSQSPSLLENSFSNYVSTLFMYGLNNKINVNAEIGYFINKTQNFYQNRQLRGSGFSNIKISLRYKSFQSKSKKHTLFSGIGLNMPLSFSPLVVDGIRLPVDLQPNSNALGFFVPLLYIYTFSNNAVKLTCNSQNFYNLYNKENYQFGAISNNTISFGYSLKKFLSVVSLRNEYKFSDTSINKTVINTGHKILFSSVQVSYFFSPDWSFSALYELPIYQYYTGLQLTQKFNVLVGISGKISKTKDKKKNV